MTECQLRKMRVVGRAFRYRHRFFTVLLAINLALLFVHTARANSLVYSFGAWPSVYETPMYQNLANLLDQSVPPTGITRVLSPNASWSWDTSITLRLQEGNTCNEHVGVEIGWEEIKRRLLHLEEKSGRYWIARLRSEPIEFPLNQIER